MWFAMPTKGSYEMPKVDFLEHKLANVLWQLSLPTQRLQPAPIHTKKPHLQDWVGRHGEECPINDQIAQQKCHLPDLYRLVAPTPPPLPCLEIRKCALARTGKCVQTCDELAFESMLRAPCEHSVRPLGAFIEKPPIILLQDTAETAQCAGLRGKVTTVTQQSVGIQKARRDGGASVTETQYRS